jgi:hypothetical protein
MSIPAMSERMGCRSFIGAVTAATVLLCMSSMACRASSKTDANRDDAGGATTATAAAAPVENASSASAVLAAANGVAAEAVADGPTDAGSDGGKRKRRRIADAGGVATSANDAVQSPVAPEPAPEPATSARRPAAAMGNEQPYGASATSGSPVLKKAPLPGDDPWK